MTTPTEVDKLIEEYEATQKNLGDLGEKAATQAAKLIEICDEQGVMPANAKAMKRLQGATRSVTVTRSTSTTIDAEMVKELGAFLGKKRQGVFARLFAKVAPPVYVPPPDRFVCVEAPGAVLEELMKRAAESVKAKVFELYGRAVQQRTNAASLKVEKAKA